MINDAVHYRSAENKRKLRKEELRRLREVSRIKGEETPQNSRETNLFTGWLN